MDPTKNPGELIQVVSKSNHFLPLIRHPSYHVTVVFI
jgi:hypothetical protein